MPAHLVLIANASDGEIACFALDSDAESPQLAHLATTPVGAGCGTFVVDEARDLVYAGVKEGPAVVTLALDRDHGTLTELSRVPVTASVAYLALAPGGRLLLGASYGGGYGFAAPVSGGHVGAETAHLEYPNLHAIIASGDGRHVYATSLGADLIAQYALTADGALTPLDPPTVAVPTGSGPRHLVLNAAGTQLYAITEFTGEVIRFARDPGSGTLAVGESAPGFALDRGLAVSALGVDPKVEHVIWGADVHLSAGEGFVVASERRASTLAVIELGPEGRLQRQVGVLDTEPQPRGFCVVPGADLVVVVGERSTTASLYRLDDAGRLTPLGRTHTGNGANWVRAIPR